MNEESNRAAGCRLGALLLCLAPLGAQDGVPVERFLLADYKNVVQVEMKALRDCGVWDDLEASALKLAFTAIEKRCGFPLKHLDRVTMVADPGAPDAPRGDQQQIFVLEGNVELGRPDSVADWQAAKIGSFDVRRDEGYRAELFVQPRPTLRVTGSVDVMTRLLADANHRGRPAADVMSLSASKDLRLAWFVVDVTHPLLREHLLEQMLPGTEWTEGDQPSFVAVRLLATGDEDDRHLTVEAALRHPRAGDGTAVTEQAAQAFVERLAAMPQMRVVKPLLQKAAIVRSGTDVTLRLDLGRARNAVGQLAALAGPLFLGVAPSAPVVVEEQVVEEPPPPPPPEPTPTPTPKPKPNPGGGGN